MFEQIIKYSIDDSERKMIDFKEVHILTELHCKKIKLKNESQNVAMISYLRWMGGDIRPPKDGKVRGYFSARFSLKGYTIFNTQIEVWKFSCLLEFELRTRIFSKSFISYYRGNHL